MDFLLSRDSFVYFPLRLEYANGKKVLRFDCSWKNITNSVRNSSSTHNAWAIRTGAISGITVFDFDNFELYQQLLATHPDLSAHLTVKTYKGVHVYFSHDARLKSPSTKVLTVDGKVEDVDLRGNNGIILCPPTRYQLPDKSTFAYSVLHDGPIVAVPNWLFAMVNDSGKVAVTLLDSLKRSLSKRGWNAADSDDDSSDDNAPPAKKACPLVDYGTEVDESDQDDDDSTVIDSDADNDMEVVPKTNFEIFADIYPHFSIERLSNYDTWLTLTCAVYNEFGNNGRVLWDRMCQRATNYNTDERKKEAARLWQTLVDGNFPKKGKGCNFQTMLMWLKTDDPVKFAGLNGVHGGIDWNDMSHTTFAQQMIDTFFPNGSLVFTGGGSSTEGFLFNGTYWIDLDGHREYLKQKFIPKLKDHYIQALNAYSPYLTLKQKNRYSNSINQLGNVAFRNNVIKAAETICYTPWIQWNKDIHLFAFNDCIYDLNTHSFIDPKPEQYINKTCTYNFKDHAVVGAEDDGLGTEKREILDFFDSICETPQVASFFIYTLSKCLIQKNVEEKAYFLLGDGRNGKGVATELQSNALGGYFVELSMNFYTKADGGPDAPNNNLFMCRYGRCINSSEIGENEKNPDKPVTFLTDKFKKLSGGDKVTVRQPHGKDQISFTAGTCFIQTNFMPVLPGIYLESNVSLQARVEVIMFPYSFITDRQKIAARPDKFKLQDCGLKEKFSQPKYRAAFIRILMHAFQNKPERPALIDEYKLRYFSDTDEVKNWFNASMVALPDNLDYTKEQKFDLKVLLEESGIKKTFKAFKAEFIILAGERDKITPKRSRGVFQNRNTYWVQGYSFANVEENDGEGNVVGTFNRFN